MNEIGAILGGRGWYEVALSKYDGLAGIYGGEWDGPVFVLTHHPPTDAHDPRVTFVSEGIQRAVDAANEGAKGKSVVVFGANTAQSLQPDDRSPAEP